MGLADKKERFLSNRAGLFEAVRLFVKRNPPHPPICPHCVIINHQCIQSNTLGKLFFGLTKGLLKALTAFGLCRVEKWKMMIRSLAQSHCVKVKSPCRACIQICIYVGGLRAVAGTINHPFTNRDHWNWDQPQRSDVFHWYRPIQGPRCAHQIVLTVSLGLLIL